MTALLGESYLHRLDPFLIEFPKAWSQLPFVPDGIRWYGTTYVAGFLIAWLMIRWLSRTGRSPVKPQAVGDLMTGIILGVLVGGRVGFALFYDRHLFVDFSSTFPFWGLLAINKGGMASHGGMIGVILACLWFARTHAVSPWHLIDLAAWTGPPGLFLGRIANFINGELWGKALPASMQSAPPSWSVKYPDELLKPSFDPDPLLAHRHELIQALNLPADIGSAPLAAAARDAMIAGHQRVIEIVQPMLTAFYPSQLAQALAEGVVLWLVVTLIWLAPRTPGVVGSWFLIVYGVLRIATEAVRQPAEGVALLWGLSRGQVLSVAMILAGALMLRHCLKRGGEPIGGLLKTGAK
jgi:phosphatidylglycerol:prolipoprotein diacylglycerol transferase